MNNPENVFRLKRTIQHCKVLFKNSRRNISLTNARKKTLEETVGIPAKPKRPLTPYFRFLKQVRPKIAQEHPKASAVNITKIVAQHWEKVDKKEKSQFEEEYKKDQEKYLAEKLLYDSKLTNEDRQKLTEARRKKQSKRRLKDKKNKCKEFNKPKKAPSPFVLYMISQYPNRGADEPFRKFQVRIAEAWKKLPDAERQPFVDKAHELNIKYKEELALWEEKMIRLGNIDIVRNESMMNTTKSEVKSRLKAKQE